MVLDDEGLVFSANDTFASKVADGRGDVGAFGAAPTGDLFVFGYMLDDPGAVAFRVGLGHA